MVWYECSMLRCVEKVAISETTGLTSEDQR